MKKNYLPVLYFFRIKEAGVIICSLFLLLGFAHAQNPLVKQWDKRFGSTDFDQLTCFQQTADGGYILAGYSGSFAGGDKTQTSRGWRDYWIVKIDQNGIKQWDMEYGGSIDDFLFAIQQTSDGGYIMGGWSVSDSSADKTQNNRDTSSNYNYRGDYWVVKADSLGNKQWDKTFGGANVDQLTSLQQTTDGGYILGGYSKSGISGDKTQPLKGTEDYWVVKIDSAGNKQWDKDFGGTSVQYLYSVQQTADGGYALGGYSYSGIGGDKTQASFGLMDFWIVKIDSAGTKLWDKAFGGTNYDYFYSLQQTTDRGFILAGLTHSDVSGNKTQPLKGGAGAINYWIVKTDSLGNKQWDNDFGGNLEDEFGNVFQTMDGGYLVSGSSYSTVFGDKTEFNLGQEQSWIVKTDSLGNKLWDKTLFTTGHDEGCYAIQTKDGCYAFANYTAAGIGGYKTQPNWDTTNYWQDYWIIKFCDTTSAMLPVSNFISSDTSFCDEGGKCIDFFDYSTGNPTSWNWLFPGATPNISNQQNPTNICYSTPGTYPVTLIVSNSAGSDTLTVSPMINVIAAPSPPTIWVSNDTIFCSHAASYQWYYNGSLIAGVTDSFYVYSSAGTYAAQITDGNGCGSLSSGMVITSVTLATMQMKAEIELYPNPAGEWFEVRGLKFEVIANIEIFNVFGEKVYSQQL